MAMKISEVESNAEQLIDTNDSNKQKYQSCKQSCQNASNNLQHSINRLKEAKLEYDRIKEELNSEMNSEQPNNERIKELQQKLAQAQKNVERTSIQASKDRQLYNETKTALDQAEMNYEMSRNSLEATTAEVEAVMGRYRKIASEMEALNGYEGSKNNEAFLNQLKKSFERAKALQSKIFNSLGKEYSNGESLEATIGKGMVAKMAYEQARAYKTLSDAGMIKGSRRGAISDSSIGSAESKNAYSLGNNSNDKQSSSSLGKNSVPSPEEYFANDMKGLKDTLSLSDGDSSTIQMVGPYKALPSSKEYERHHIPSKAALVEFGVDTDKWPCICLENEDHKKTDSFRGKQRKTTNSFIPGSGPSKTYKQETIDMIDAPGGFSDLVRDEIYNIRAACGDKYDKAIGEFLDTIVEHVNKNGVPKRQQNMSSSVDASSGFGRNSDSEDGGSEVEYHPIEYYQLGENDEIEKHIYEQPLVIDTDVLQPVSSHCLRFQNQQTATEWAKKTFKDWRQTLSPEQEEGIRQYGGSLYGAINGQSRFIHRPNEGISRVTQLIDDGLSQSYLPCDMVVYRGLSETDVMDMARHAGGALERGITLNELGFLSTSMTSDTSYCNGCSCIMRLVAVEGIHGAPLIHGDLASVSSEVEMLFSRNLGIYIKHVVRCPRSEIVLDSEDSEPVTVIDGVLTLY